MSESTGLLAMAETLNKCFSIAEYPGKDIVMTMVKCSSPYTFQRNSEGKFEPVENYETHELAKWAALFSIRTEGRTKEVKLLEIGDPNMAPENTFLETFATLEREPGEDNPIIEIIGDVEYEGKTNS